MPITRARILGIVPQNIKKMTKIEILSVQKTKNLQKRMYLKAVAELDLIQFSDFFIRCFSQKLCFNQVSSEPNVLENDCMTVLGTELPFHDPEMCSHALLTSQKNKQKSKWR